VKPRGISLRASIDQLAQELVRQLFGAFRCVSFDELDELLRSPPSQPVPAATHADASPHDVLAELTPRQRAIFERALHGSRNADIARDLGITLKTVQTHRAQVNKKLGIRSGSELVRFGAVHGLLNPESQAGLARARNPATASVPLFNLAEVERLTIGAAMSAAEGDRDRAAGLLGLSRSALDAKLRPLKPATAASSLPTPTPRVPTRSPRTNPPGEPNGSQPNGSVVRPADPIESFPELVIADPAAVLGTIEPARNAHETLPAAASPRRAPNGTTRRPRDASIASESTPPLLEPAPPVRAGEQVLRATGGGVVLRRRPRSASDSPKLDGD
jgi:DNA-binding CsgD family transcriptional regulator